MLIENTLRGALRELHGKPAGALPAVPYRDDGPHFAEWLVEVLPGCAPPLTAEDARYVLALLKADVRSQLLAGYLPSPELRATMLRWQHGSDQALLHFVNVSWARGEMPDDNVTWLLLHPGEIPANFPLYQRSR